MTQRLRVDPIACKAHEMCAELFPERVRLDDWGYPIIDARGIPEELVEQARRAVAECPRSALRLVPVDEPGARGSGGETA
jgi:ferredoxin